MQIKDLYAIIYKEEKYMSELKHVGIIVDGNGRWAISRNKKRIRN